jgi:hypothetical protein
LVEQGVNVSGSVIVIGRQDGVESVRVAEGDASFSTSDWVVESYFNETDKRSFALTVYFDQETYPLLDQTVLFKDGRFVEGHGLFILKKGNITILSDHAGNNITFDGSAFRIHNDLDDVTDYVKVKNNRYEMRFSNKAGGWDMVESGEKKGLDPFAVTVNRVYTKEVTFMGGGDSWYALTGKGISAESQSPASMMAMQEAGEFEYLLEELVGKTVRFTDHGDVTFRLCPDGSDVCIDEEGSAVPLPGWVIEAFTTGEAETPTEDAVNSEVSEADASEQIATLPVFTSVDGTSYHFPAEDQAVRDQVILGVLKQAKLAGHPSGDYLFQVQGNQAIIQDPGIVASLLPGIDPSEVIGALNRFVPRSAPLAQLTENVDPKTGISVATATEGASSLMLLCPVFWCPSDNIVEILYPLLPDGMQGGPFPIYRPQPLYTNTT